MVRYAGRFATGAINPILIALTTALLFASCSKDAQDTDQSSGGKPPTAVGPGAINHFRLDNGINVYLREDRSRPQVAVVALYSAGVIHEDAGEVHVSRVLPHMRIFSPTVSFEADGAVDAISKTGRANGEVFGDFVRFDYTAASDQLELLFKVEAERLTSVEFKEDQLKKYATKCRDDVDKVLEEAALSMSKYGLMALNQALNYGVTSVPIYNGVYDVTIDDLERFSAARYGLADMVLVVVGDFDTAAATELIKKYFGGIEKRRSTVGTTRPADGDIVAHWDVESTVMFLLYPGPYQNEQERLVLTMFGTYMSRQLKGDAELNRDLKSSLCSSTLHPVGDIPFFVFAETRRGRKPQDIRPKILKIVNESMQSVDAKTFDMMKGRLATFLESSILESQRTLSNMPHYKVLVQEALNIGTRHYMRNGRAAEEFLEMVNAITYEDARRYLDSRLAPEQMRVVTIRGQ
jgi:predicted Zn-dependent peptidase